jgi:SAM-dependent methyltransferase
MTRVSRKEVEAAYFNAIGVEGLVHAASKPWSDPQCGNYLQELGPLFALAPPPPGRLLDIGCGAGWTSALFATRSYQVTGIDLSPEAITFAREHHDFPNLGFEVQDFDRPYGRPGQFDIAVFFDALHHSEDEVLPLRLAFDALRPGGVCLICEPGKGHADAETSKNAFDHYGVQERDMTPEMVIRAARSIGFTSWDVYPHPQRFAVPAYRPRPKKGWTRQRILSHPVVVGARAFYAATLERRSWGLVQLVK